jgi:hypothetical protein
MTRKLANGQMTDPTAMVASGSFVVPANDLDHRVESDRSYRPG